MPVEPQYANKEALLEYARKRANTGSTSTSKNVRRDIQNSSSSDTGAETEGNGETPGSVGRNGSFQDSAGGNGRFIDQFSNWNNQSPRSYSSTHQLDSGTRGGGVSWGDRVKQVVKPFQEAIKTTPQKKKIPGKKEPFRRLTDTEVLKMSKPLVESLIWLSEHIDEFIAATTKGHQEVEIWGDLDKADCEIISEYLISRGKVDARTAQVVRELVTLLDRIKLAVIVTPRVYKTFKIYLERGISIR